MYLSSVSSRLLLYDTNNWDLKKSYTCYEGVMRDISWSDDSKYMLQVNSIGLVEVLSPTDHDIKSVQHIPLDTWSATFHRDGHRNVAIGTRSGKVMIWDTKTKATTKTFPLPARRSSVIYLSYNARNTSLAATMQSGETIIYSLVSNIPVLTIKLPCSESISAMKFHHESRSLLGLATDDGHIVLKDVTTNKDKATFENIHASPVSDFSFSLINKDVLLSTGLDKIMNVYDIRLQNVVNTVRTPYTLTSMSVNIENQVALGARNGYVLLYDLRDLTNPFKVLKDHNEEVSKVAFQPIKKKTISAELSLREEIEVSTPAKVQSPIRTRTSDMFFVNDTPPKLDVNSHLGDNKADSFLLMLGLDKSNNDIDDGGNKSADFEKKNEVRYLQLDAEKNISKVSTPLNSRTAESLGFTCSPLSGQNGVTDDKKSSITNLSTLKTSNSNIRINTIDTKAIEDLKDFVKLSLSDVADDNRNYFLHIMMVLTKQKLYLEKQLNTMHQQIQSLVHNQNDLVEANRKLTIQLDQIKSQQNIHSMNNLM